MPELRKDYVTDTWVVFSASRAQRPGAFRGGRSTTDPEKCPFCYGHEHMTPPEVLAYRKDGVPNGPGWWIRCVPNKYPALQVEGEVHRRVSQLFHSVNGVGAHGHHRDAGARAPPVHAERIPGAGDHYRLQAAVPRPDPRQAVQVHPDLQEPRGAGGRVDFPSALTAHRDPDRAASDRGGGQRPQSLLRVDRRILPLLRNRRDGARGREADRLGERIVHLPVPVRGSFPLRGVDSPEGARNG